MKTLTTSLSRINVTKYESTVKAVVNRLLLSRRIAQYSIERDDLYQIGWMAVMNCARTFDINRGVKFETYASKAITHAVNKELKRLSLQKTYSAVLDVADEYADADATQLMSQLIGIIEDSGKFNKRERKIFWLKFTEGLCFTDIGKQLGVSRETARKVYVNSTERLKELLADEF